MDTSFVIAAFNNILIAAALIGAAYLGVSVAVDAWKTLKSVI